MVSIANGLVKGSLGDLRVGTQGYVSTGMWANLVLRLVWGPGK